MEQDKVNESDTNGLKKGQWSTQEDEILAAYVKEHGEGNWNLVSKNSGLARCGKSCRFRWLNHLKSDLKRGPLSIEEKQKIIRLYDTLGPKWSKMAIELPGRTDNEIKNFWNIRKRKREKEGLPPLCHRSIKHEDENNSKFQDSFHNVPNMVQNNVDNTTISNNISPTLIKRGEIEIPYMKLEMISELPPLPPSLEIQNFEYPLFSNTMSNYEYTTYSPPTLMETQYETSQPISPRSNGILESIFYNPNILEDSQIKLIDEEGNNPISLEEDVEANHGSLKNDTNKIPNDIKDTLYAIIYGKGIPGFP